MPSKKRSLLAASGAGGDSLYVEDVFSTYLYAGTGATHNIVNDIDLSGEGGMVWSKTRDTDVRHSLVDTERGAAAMLTPNETWANQTTFDSTLSFNSDGYTLGADAGNQRVNNSAYDYVGWTFRKAEKFFDVVTYTGDGTSNRQIAHNLETAPACIIVKRLNNTANWAVWHQGFNGGSTTGGGFLNLTGAFGTEALFSNNSSAFSDSYFLVSNSSNRETNGYLDTYVAYVFASDAGGFGDDGTENIIKCGSFNTYAEINLGFEPQWVLYKRSDGAGSWSIVDNMRGWVNSGNDKILFPDTSGAESDGQRGHPTASGMLPINGGSDTYIYIAIRRPMKTPESGTEVFSPNIWTGDGSPEVITTGFSPDVSLGINRGAVHASTYLSSRLTGMDRYLSTTTNAAENSDTASVLSMDGITINSGNLTSGFGGGQTYVGEFFKRAPSFMDVVAYTGNGTAGATQAHNLGVAPELIIVKKRDAQLYGSVYNKTLTASKYLTLFGAGNSAAAADTGAFNGTEPTASVFTLGFYSNVNTNGGTYIAYLFATLAGVSKVGSYTGTGAALNVDCGFTAGARFILIKRTDSTGDWYTYDSVRGISAGNDPYLLLNTTAAEVTGTDYIDPLNAGFTVTSTAPAGLNANGGTYIFLSIA